MIPVCTHFRHVLAHRSPLSRRNYRAAIVKEYGGKLEVVERKAKAPASDQILLQVDSAGVNFTDINMMKGKHYLKPVLPFVPGFELAGTVAGVGKGVRRWKEGDRVFALCSKGTGAFAEQCVIDQDEPIFPLPNTMDFETAAGLPMSYGGAYFALQSLAALQKGNSVLVLTSRGATGIAAIDLAQNVFEMQVIGASDSEEKLATLRSMGIQTTINWRETPEFGKVMRKRTPFASHGVDFVIDTVGGRQFAEAINCVKSGGHIISLGFSSGEAPTVSILDLHRVWLGGRDRSELERVMETVIGLCDERYITPSIARSYPLGEIADCIEELEKDRVFGKAVITCRAAKPIT